MKKIMTLAIMALFIGGLTFSANAQIKTNRTTAPKQETVKKADKPNALTSEKKEAAKAEKQAVEQKELEKKQIKSEDWNKQIKEFETVVDKCVSAYEKIQKNNDKSSKNDSKEFDTYLQKAQNLKAKIEKGKPALDRTQVDRYNKACEKLSKVLIK